MNLICGINPVIEALTAGTRHFDRLLVVKGLRSRRLSEAIGRATRLGIPLRFEMRDTLDRLSDGVPHQGLIAVVSAKPVLSLEELLETVSDPALLVALDGVEDPRNLGAILRSVEAAGADGALLPERHSAGLSEAVARSSAGALEHVDVARIGNLVQAIETLKSRGIWVVGFDASGTERWDAVDLTGSVLPRARRRGSGHSTPGPRPLRPPRVHPALRPRQLPQRLGGGRHRPVRGGAPARGGAERGSSDPPAAPAEEKRVVGPHPDDSESDPGAAPVPPNAEGLADEMPEEDDHGPETLSPHVDIHGEDVAWGQGPTVLKPVNSRRGRRPPERRRKSGARRPAADAGQSRSEGARREPKARTGKARDPKSRERTATKDRDQPEARGRWRAGEAGRETGGGKRRQEGASPSPPQAPGLGRCESRRSEADCGIAARIVLRRRLRRGPVGLGGRREVPVFPRPAPGTGPSPVASSPGGRHRACIPRTPLLHSPFVAGVAQR